MIDVHESFNPALRKLCFHFLECDMIMVTVFLSISNQLEFHLVQNQKENCHHDHIRFNVKGNGNIVFSLYVKRKAERNNKRQKNSISAKLNLTSSPITLIAVERYFY